MFKRGGNSKQSKHWCRNNVLSAAEQHSKEQLLKLWEQESKSTKTGAKNDFEKKVEWLNENWKVEKAN